MSHVIAIHELTKRFGGKTAVNRLSLKVPAGAIFALLGDNAGDDEEGIFELAQEIIEERWKPAN